MSRGSDPAGPYYVYYLNANYNPAEAGSPNLLNDFAKIGVTRDAFLLFYDEFPLLGNGVGGGIFNGPSNPCPEGGINPNADNMTQASQAQGQLWAATVTEVNQIFASGKNPGTEIHNGAAYWVIGTDSFDKTGAFSMTDQGYVSAAREDMEMPAIAAEGTGGNNEAIMLFTMNGNEGPNGATNGGYYPSTAYGRLTTASHGLTGSVMNIADAGRSPTDGFTEYQPFPSAGSPPRPRWGDANWGTSVNYVVP